MSLSEWGKRCLCPPLTPSTCSQSNCLSVSHRFCLYHIYFYITVPTFLSFCLLLHMAFFPSVTLCVFVLNSCDTLSIGVPHLRHTRAMKLQCPLLAGRCPNSAFVDPHIQRCTFFTDKVCRSAEQFIIYACIFQKSIFQLTKKMFSLFDCG